MSHRILHDEGIDALRMCQRHAEAYGPPIVLHVECVSAQAKYLREIIDDPSDVVEGLVKLLWVRPIAVAKTGIVWRDQVVLVRESCQ